MNNKFKNRKILFLIPFVILFALSGIVMWLWNAILPEVTGVASVTYWQAMGILVLSKILFGGFHGFRKHRDYKRRHFYHKMKNMSPEEREKLKEKLRDKFHKKGFCNH